MGNSIIYKDKLYCWPLKVDELSYFYLIEKLSCTKIGKLFGVDSGTITWLKNKYDIPLLEAWCRLDVPKELNSQEKEVVLGYLLGDGCLGMTAKQAHLRVSQCEKQRSYVEQMYNYLKRWASYSIVTDRRKDKRYNKEYVTCRFDSVCHPVFTELRQACYPNGVKTISEEWLDQIGPLGLALWYEGDGGLSSEITPMLHTNSFSLAENDLIVDWLRNSFNIDSHVTKYDKYYRVFIDDGFDFGELVKPFTIEYFEYKLPTRRKKLLSRKDVESIMSLKNSGITNRKIATIHSVSESVIGKLYSGKTYAK